MNEERYYILTLTDKKRYSLKRILLVKGIFSFLSDDDILLVVAQKIIKEKGYSLIWTPLLDLRNFTNVNVEVMEFNNLDAADLAFECLD